MKARHGMRGNGGALAIGLALSASVHVVVLLYGTYSVPTLSDASERTTSGVDEPALQLVQLEAEPEQADLADPEPGLASAAAAQTLPPASERSVEEKGLAGLPSLQPSALSTRTTHEALAPGTGTIPTFELEPTATSSRTVVGEVADAVPQRKRRGLLGILGDFIKGVSVAVVVPCGDTGTAGGPVGGGPGIPRLPGTGGVGGAAPDIPGATGKPQIPTGPGSGGMPGIPSTDAGGAPTDGGGPIRCQDPQTGRGGWGGLGGILGGGGAPSPTPAATPGIRR